MRFNRIIFVLLFLTGLIHFCFFELLSYVFFLIYLLLFSLIIVNKLFFIKTKVPYSDVFPPMPNEKYELSTEQMVRFIESELANRGQKGRKVFVNHIFPRSSPDNQEIYHVEFKIINAEDNEPFGGFWTVTFREGRIALYQAPEE